MRTSTLAVIFFALVSCQRQDAVEPKPAPGKPPSPSAQTVTPPSPSRGAGAQHSYADVVDRVGPGVVTVRSERRVRTPRQHPFFNDPLFQDFFGGLFGAAPFGREFRQMGLGSGVIVRPEGYILTNHHVIDGAQDIKIELLNRRSFNAKIVGSDPPSDLAVLKIEARDLPALSLGDSDRVRVGDVVLALGNPLGIGQTVTA